MAVEGIVCALFSPFLLAVGLAMARALSSLHALRLSLSWNCGCDGPTEDDGVAFTRIRQVRRPLACQADRQAGGGVRGQPGREEGGCLGSQGAKQPSSQADRQTSRQADRQTSRQAGGWVGRQAARSTDRQPGLLRGWQADRLRQGGG